jgi:hypothetical protein
MINAFGVFASMKPKDWLFAVGLGLLVVPATHIQRPIPFKPLAPIDNPVNKAITLYHAVPQSFVIHPGLMTGEGDDILSVYSCEGHKEARLRLQRKLRQPDALFNSSNLNTDCVSGMGFSEQLPSLHSVLRNPDL